MIINQANLSSLYKGFSSIFKEVFDTASALYPRLATEVPSTSRQEEYKWLGRVPRMREWLGERVIQNLSAYSYTIKNLDWEATVAVDRNDVEDDAVGIYTPMVRALADAAATHPDELVFDLLAGGFTNVSYDGRPALQAILEDITERKQTEEALKDSEERYRTLIEGANDAVFLENVTGQIVDVNTMACRMLGYSRDEILKLNMADLLQREGETELPQREITQQIEEALLRKDGTRVAVEVNTSTLRLKGEKFHMSVVRDITVRKEKELRQRHLEPEPEGVVWHESQIFRESGRRTVILD